MPSERRAWYVLFLFVESSVTGNILQLFFQDFVIIQKRLRSHVEFLQNAVKPLSIISEDGDIVHFSGRMKMDEVMLVICFAFLDAFLPIASI